MEPPVTGSGKGNRSGNSRFLLSAISFTQKENGKLSHVIDVSIFNLYKKITAKDEDNQVSVSVDIGQQLCCLNISNECLYTFLKSSAIKEIPSLSVQQSGLPTHGTIRISQN